MKGIQVLPNTILQHEAIRSGDLLQEHTLDLNKNSEIYTS